MSHRSNTFQPTDDDGRIESSSARNAPSSSGKPKEPPKKVTFDHVGFPVGPGSGKPATSLGDLTRSQISVKYASWDVVPDDTKDKLWTNFKEKFSFKDSQRKDQMMKAAMAWRRYKNTLRNRHLKPSGTLQNWLDAIPESFIPEDWHAFCTYESSPQAKAVKAQNKKNRINSASRGTHTSGRYGYNRAAWNFKEIHGRKPTRIELWLYTHKRKCGGYAPHDALLARKFEEFLQLMHETDDVEPFDCDSFINSFKSSSIRKRTRCIPSTMTSTRFAASAFAREMLEEVESERDVWKNRLESIEATNAMLVSKVDELIEAMRSGKFKDGANQKPSGNISTNPGSSNSLPESTKCKILGWGNVVVAHGRRTPCGSADIMHGHKLGPEEAKVLVDRVIDPEYPVWNKRQGCATTLSDIGVGGFMYWHEAYLVPDHD
ncbi:hypothetical protein ACHQM5_003044 [Ranunculus cassubicifolius]